MTMLYSLKLDDFDTLGVCSVVTELDIGDTVFVTRSPLIAGGDGPIYAQHSGLSGFYIGPAA